MALRSPLGPGVKSPWYLAKDEKRLSCETCPTSRIATSQQRPKANVGPPVPLEPGTHLFALLEISERWALGRKLAKSAGWGHVDCVRKAFTPALPSSQAPTNGEVGFLIDRWPK